MQHPTKKCSVCGEEKPKTEFYTKGFRPSGKQRISSRCHKCDHKKSYKQKKTKSTHCRLIYRRQVKNSKKRGHPEPSYSSTQLKEWMLSKEEYHRLHAEWVESGYNKNLTPSIDRLDDYKPYTFDNIRIVTWQENNRSHHESRMNGINNKTNKAILQLSLQGEVINRFHSREEAGRVTGFDTSYIGDCANGKHKTAYGYRWKNE